MKLNRKKEKGVEENFLGTFRLLVFNQFYMLIFNPTK